MSGQLLLWTDIETTGLDECKDAILEIGMLVTDWDLHAFDSGFHAVIRPNGWWWRKRRLSERVQDMHRPNRLLRAVDGGNAVDTTTAIDAMNDYLNPYFADQGLLLAGSSVDFDRRFIKRLAPELFVWYRLGHRVMDVSVLDEIARIQYPELHDHRPERTTDHRVTNCLHDSMHLYRYYQEHLLVSKESRLS